MKKIYEVIGHKTIVVKKRVKANSEEEAFELAEEFFNGIHSFLGNGGDDKLIGVYDDSESIECDDSYIDWQSAEETNDERYDTDTDDSCVFRCSICGAEFECESDEDFDDYVEQELWGHIQMNHEEEFEECQDWETPDMIEEYYEREEN